MLPCDKMYLFSLLVLLISSAGKATEELTDNTTVPEWTVFNTQRLCKEDNAQCEYKFLIAEMPDKAPQFCNFAVRASDDKPATQVSWKNATCNCTDDYRIDAGYDEKGFVVMTITNKNESRYAFFGFNDEQLADGKEVNPQVSPVYKNGTQIGNGRAIRAGLALIETATEWQISYISRRE
jgi:hypothetical protein